MKSAILNILKIEDPRGNLSVIEKNVVPFPIKRVYYLYDVPSGAERGGHAHKIQEEFIIAVSGSFDVILNDGTEEKVFSLNRPNSGLYVSTKTWRELRNFSSGAVCLVVSSGEFDEQDYIRNYDDFLAYLK
ncbi:sugar 3,4-ketoisomerase [Daejeonia sp. YH14]|uniref:sugar 3,4-ketoisomerase n=1 Tax=Daejeonia sp. YH14 TaxID=3439042 RepID=UPI003F49358F